MPSPLQEISQAIAAAQSAGRSFAARAAAAEALEIHALDRLEILAQGGWDPAALRPLQAGAQAALAGLEAAQQRTLGRLRGRIRAGLYSGPGLRRALLRHAGPAGPAGAFDGMDPLLQGLLGQGEPAGPRRPLEPDMVAYQPTPARAILALVQASGIGPQDLLVDLGSGLGQVALLAALLSGARARGVELEPSYVDYARACAQGLQLGRVEFIHADAREAPLDGGTVFSRRSGDAYWSGCWSACGERPGFGRSRFARTGPARSKCPNNPGWRRWGPPPPESPAWGSSKAAELSGRACPCRPGGGGGAPHRGGPRPAQAGARGRSCRSAGCSRRWPAPGAAPLPAASRGPMP